MNYSAITQLLKCKRWHIMFVCCCLNSIALAQTQSTSIDLSQRGAPISKYLYGQFIEHLGRSIYGGIWAEMLEDRKFYYPIDAEGANSALLRLP